ncbi:MAG: NAD(P)(+) transhydrogenase (Re/Si-specific) subunit alpha, partial [Actinobacteria bacterium]|nr:NAD(P)(+) transhydrogenase (Re/Si-specific) subunit alpha [Actinomycetota bacterium]
MPASVGVPRETEPGERRVALVPAMAAKLLAAGLNVIMERGAGFPSMYPDAEYEGVRLEQHARAVWQADIVLKVQPPSLPEVRLLRE